MCPYSPPLCFSQPLYTVSTFQHGALSAKHFHIMASQSVSHRKAPAGGRNLHFVWRSAALQWCGYFVIHRVRFGTSCQPQISSVLKKTQQNC
jgi:hypothetical protein